LSNGTTKPVTSFLTKSALPPTSVTTQGKEQLIASFSGNLSTVRRLCRHGAPGGRISQFELSGLFIYIAGRALYLPLYALGVPWLRTFSWYIATLGVVLAGVQVGRFGVTWQFNVAGGG